MIYLKPPKIPSKKSKEELEFYKEFGSIFGDLLFSFAVYVRDNKIEEDLSEVFKKLCRFSFGRKVTFPFSIQVNPSGKFGQPICVSVNEEIAHGRTEILNQGDIVSIDCGISLPFNKRKLNFDAAFTVCRQGADSQDWIKAPKEALAEIVKLQPETTEEIAKIIEDTASKYKLQQVVSLTGHGIGYNLHEYPPIHNATGRYIPVDLFDGFVFCAEPIYVKSLFPNKPSEAKRRVASTYIREDGWTIATINGSPSSHFETMYGVINGQLIDLIGVSEWKL